MGGLKKGTGSLDFDEEPDEEDDDIKVSESEAEEKSANTEAQLDQQAESESPTETASSSEGLTQAEAQAQTQAGEFDMDSLPYLVQRQMRGASVNADRTKQLLLEVRPFVKEGEEAFLDDLQDLVDGPVYKGDAREAAMVVAQEHPELVAEKLREWGIEYLDK
ncbi:hypothetical protein [Natronomonas gomsonensis]|uniref:hypothetical protein n=1 Tax=Natronomonas gomsonensis TaxID=1046043 RepID=UPI00227CEC32|nr:hypothetical protein [Natronomonas gomsonensis]